MNQYEELRQMIDSEMEILRCKLTILDCRNGLHSGIEYAATCTMVLERIEDINRKIQDEYSKYKNETR